MKCIAISFVILLSLFVLCFTHYDDYGQAPAEPRLLETSEDLKDFLDHIDEDPAVVGYFDSDSSPDYEVFRSVSAYIHTLILVDGVVIN